MDNNNNMREMCHKNGELSKLTKHKIKKKRKEKRIIEEPTSIFRKRRRFQLNDNLLVSREESERRLQVGCLGLAFTLSLLCSLLVIFYSQTLHECEPFIFTPNITVKPNLCKQTLKRVFQTKT